MNWGTWSLLLIFSFYSSSQFTMVLMIVPRFFRATTTWRSGNRKTKETENWKIIITRLTLKEFSDQLQIPTGLFDENFSRLREIQLSYCKTFILLFFCTWTSLWFAIKILMGFLLSARTRLWFTFDIFIISLLCCFFSLSFEIICTFHSGFIWQFSLFLRIVFTSYVAMWRARVISIGGKEENENKIISLFFSRPWKSTKLCSLFLWTIKAKFSHFFLHRASLSCV